MNPSSALFGAMNKERKPFTYTPGGLDLSEIKSERMAQRLMRNAMSEGVPETQVQSIQSPPPLFNPSALPNFNCLPVQVFPTFALPANPKSLLRSRSNPDPSKTSNITKNIAPVPNYFISENKTTTDDWSNVNKPSSYPLTNNEVLPTSKNNNIEEKTITNEGINDVKPSLFTLNDNNPLSIARDYIEPQTSTDEWKKIHTLSLSNEEPSKNKDEVDELKPTINEVDVKTSTNISLCKPDSFYLNDANALLTTENNKELRNSSSLKTTNHGSDDYLEITLPEKSYDAEYFVMEPQKNIQMIENKCSHVENEATMSHESYDNLISNIAVDNVPSIGNNSVELTSLSQQERITNDNEQKKVKIVKKQSKNTRNEVEQNGETESAVVVKLPTKKSSAKTETKVEVLKKTLPDGTVEEVKTTITKTTIDGKTEIKTETETRILPKDENNSVEIEEQEEEEVEEIDAKESEDSEETLEQERSTVTTKEPESETVENVEEPNIKNEIKENGHIISGEEKSEISTTKKVVVIQSTDQEPEDEIEEEIEEETEDGDVEVEQVIVLKKVEEKEKSNDVEFEENRELQSEVVEDEEVEEVEEEEEVIDEDNNADEQENIRNDKKDAEEPFEEEVEPEEIEAEEVEVEEEQNDEDDNVEEQEKEAEEESQEAEKTITASQEKKELEGDVEEEYEEAEDVLVEVKPTEDICSDIKDENVETFKEEAKQIEDESKCNEKPSVEPSESKEDITQQKTDEQERVIKIMFEPEPKVIIPSFKEPSIPLEKVEDIEIKPIGPAQEIIKKCHTEIITTTKDEPTGALSTQTNYNRIENIVTVNRTTKTLDPALEPAQITIPSVNSYFTSAHSCPPDRILSTPQPISRSYQPTYTPEPQTERRHSLLLDRLSVDRQIPAQQPDIYQNTYQYTNQSYDQNQWTQEPQSEVLTVSNVKPSTISKNQQWYQQSKREENYTSNIVTPTPIMPSQISQAQSQPKPKPQQQPQQPQPPQQQYQTYEPLYTPTQEFQPTYVDNSKQNSFKSNTTNFQQTNTYPSYTPKPSWVSSTFDSKPTPVDQYNQYSTLKKETSESYQKTTQPFSSSYVPPPWEQDSSYVIESQNFYQPPPTTTYTPNTNQSWKPKPPASKYSKPAPKAYIPPAPNQSFVKPVSSEDVQILPGRKTYYSEYERRYISVPESTYIPTETKYQAQPDPSPQYYYDNNEPTETVEPQWRKELREFKEKSSYTTTTQTEKTSVKPPWEEDSKYATGYNTYHTTTVTPSWTQTLRPRSWRETSYEPEYIGSKEWPKTNTLGRGRPQSSYVRKNVETVRERTRGVSVDRYNPNSYQSPLASEHPPVQSHTLNINPKTYHNPNVPSYHARTSAESREQPAPYIQRTWSESKAPPVQSRSFKYLQWITGTED